MCFTSWKWSIYGSLVIVVDSCFSVKKPLRPTESSSRWGSAKKVTSDPPVCGFLSFCFNSSYDTFTLSCLPSLVWVTLTPSKSSHIPSKDASLDWWGTSSWNGVLTSPVLPVFTRGVIIYCMFSFLDEGLDLVSKWAQIPFQSLLEWLPQHDYGGPYGTSSIIIPLILEKDVQQAYQVDHQI